MSICTVCFADTQQLESTRMRTPIPASGSRKDLYYIRDLRPAGFRILLFSYEKPEFRNVYCLPRSPIEPLFRERVLPRSVYRSVFESNYRKPVECSATVQRTCSFELKNVSENRIKCVPDAFEALSRDAFSVYRMHPERDLFKSVLCIYILLLR